MAELPICDMHSHILPGIDDGCKTAEEAVSQLACCNEQHIQRAFLTPHYYHREPVRSFLEKREQAWDGLCRAMDAEKGAYPELRMGAEVAFFRGISYADDIEQLRLGRSRYLLLEMPFSYWSDSVLQEVASMEAMFGIKPVIAHIERYLPFQDSHSLQSLLEQDVLIQMNAEYILSRSTRHKAKKLIRSGVVDLLGSDCHNLTTRKQNLGEACGQLCDWKLQDTLQTMMENADYIFDEDVFAC